MSKSIKKVAIFAATTMAILSLTACANNESGSKSGVTTVKISWRYTGKGDSMVRLYNKQWIKDFEAKHKNIKVELQPITSSEGDYPSKIELAMKSSSTTPDVVNEDTFLLPSDAAAGYLAPLNSYVSKWSDWSQFNPAIKKGSQGVDGKQYGIPGTTDSRGIWTNTALLKKAGFAANWQPKSWQDIIDAAKKIKEAAPDSTPFAMGVSTTNGESVSMQTFEQLLYGTGETLYNEKTDKWNINSKGILNSLKFINQIFNVDKTGPSLSIAMSSNYGSTTMQSMLPKDQLGMVMDGIWNTGNWATGGAAPISNVTSKLNFALMPTETGQGKGFVTMSGGWTWSIPEKVKDKTAAFTVLEAMNTKEMAVERALLEGTLTVRDDSAKDPKYLEKPFIKQATAALSNAFYRPKSTLYPKVSVAIQNAVESVASGSKTPEAAAAKYASDVKGIVGADHTETQK